MAFYTSHGKRTLELAMVILASPIWLSVVGMLCISLRLFQGKGVLFRQERPGRNGEPFTLLKFRTMTADEDSNGNPFPDEERLTSLGRFLRRTSLDELPELLNVLQGQMSLVGPRPLLVQYLERYSPQQARRHEVRPGITGWAQVNGRNALSWEQKFEFDVWYVDHVGFGLDLKILGMTIWKVLKGEGLSAAGHATMPEFMGTPDE